MAALGDFGGFNDGLILVFGSILTIYSSRMYEARISSELPVIEKKPQNEVQA